MEVQQRDVPVQVVGQLEGPQVVDILVQGVGQVVPPQVVDVERPVQQQQQGMSFQVDTFILISFYRQTDIQTIDRVLHRASKCWGSAFT